MKSYGKAVLIAVALVFGGYSSLALATDTTPMATDYQEDCVVDERSNCEERCLTEHNCCIKSCNWVQPKAKSKCLKHCESILNKCRLECDEQPAEDEGN